MLKLELTRRKSMLKVLSAVALIAATVSLTFIGSETARADMGFITNGTSLKGHSAIAGSAQVVGLVLPNGTSVSVR